MKRRTNHTPAGHPKITIPASRNTVACNPADFGKPESPVRDRMARNLYDTSPDERLFLQKGASR